MSHKVHPHVHRLTIIRGWQSRWFASGEQFKKVLKADILLREFLEKRLRGKYVDAFEIECGRNELRILIKTARPGMVIGRSGEGSAKLKNDIIGFLKKAELDIPKNLRLDIEEVKNPETRARIVAQMIAEGLEKRFPFKRAMKQMMDKVLANKTVQGVRITVAGRLGGAEIGRSETLKQGALPLQTLCADIDFAREKAFLPYGVIGIKVWIFRKPVT